MKKVAYIAGGILIGVVLSTAGGAFADTVKSMVGKKVTGEYTVIVDGKKLSDKGAVIDSRANVPARALSDALGADVKVSGKTITITSNSEDNASVDSTITTPTPQSNKYLGQSKSSLEESKKITQEKILIPTKEIRESKVAQLADLEKVEGGDFTPQVIANLKKEIADLDAEIAKYEEDVKLIDEALAAIK
ncbi:stalk domain-containing protein [Paenibacillus illinoisensis]|uniref:stalk domain-containing protein n=1 Tax=Paenibacillus illinoisensis TaxID=59845 RepID=UPI000FDB0825|nr:stalk domain-containing protein [Paenibacillus illinoisensis]